MISWIKKCWLTVLLGLLCVVFSVATVAAVWSGYIWVGERGHYAIIRIAGNADLFWALVGAKAYIAGFFGWATHWMYEAEKLV